MSPDNLAQIIIQYRYAILIPLSLIEGPIVAVIAGTLAAGGYFNIFILEGFFIIRDLVTDIAYYMLGMYAGRSALVKRLLRAIGLTDASLDKAKRLWDVHPFRTMFLGKLSYGIAPSFFVVAGMVRMRLTRFLGYNGLVATLQYGVLLCVGYYFGAALGAELFNIASNIQYAIGGLVIIYVIIFFVRSRFGKELLREECEEV